MNYDDNRILNKFLNRFRVIVEYLIQLVYPQDIYCICCEKPISDRKLYSMCSSCLSAFTWANGNLCSTCGKLLEDWYPDDLCAECKNKVRVFDRGITCARYGEREREVIKSFKYHGKAYLARTMAEIMADRLEFEILQAERENCLIVPVPLHKKKEKKRGYNQAALLGKYLAQNLKIDYSDTILLRGKNTEPMNQLNEKDRTENLKDAFSLAVGERWRVKNRKIYLIDDIFTTGTTADFCSDLLKKGGAVEVIIFSFAAGRNQRVLPERKGMM